MQSNIENTDEIMSATIRVRLASWLASQGVVRQKLVIPGDTFNQFLDRFDAYVQSLPKQDRPVWDDAFFDSRGPEPTNETIEVRSEPEVVNPDPILGSNGVGDIRAWLESEDEESETDPDD